MYRLEGTFGESDLLLETSWLFLLMLEVKIEFQLNRKPGTANIDLEPTLKFKLILTFKNLTPNLIRQKIALKKAAEA